MTGYDNRRTYGSYNPFDAIQSTPYVSMRNDLPFDLYMDVLSKGEERYQKGLEVESKIDMALNNINAYGKIGNKKLKDLRENIKSNLQDFSSKAGSYADPDVLNAMTKYANTISSEIKPFIEYENMRKADEELRFKEPNPVEIDLPQTEMFDEKGNSIPYKRNWQPGLDPTTGKAKVWNLMEADINETLKDIDTTSKNGLLKVSTEQIKTIKNKLTEGANIYLNTNEGKQQVLVEATNLQKQAIINGKSLSREQAIEIAKEKISEEFIKESAIRDSRISNLNLMGDPNYNKSSDKDLTDSERFVVPTLFGVSNENKFKSSKDLRGYSEVGTQKEQIKNTILKSLNVDPDILQSQQNLSNLINKQHGVHNPELLKIKEDIFDVIAQAYNNGKNIPLLADLNLLEDNWISLKEDPKKTGIFLLNGLISLVNGISKNISGNPILNYIDENSTEEEVRSKLRNLRGNEEISEFINATKEHFALMDAKIENILKESGDFAVQPVAISTYHEGYTADTKAIQQSIELTQQDNFKPIYKDQKINPDNKIIDVPMISRFSNKLIFYAKDNKGNIIPVDIKDKNTRNNILNSFKNAAFDVAESYKNYKGVTSDGTGFKKYDGKVENLPENYKIKPKYFENSIYYGLYKYDNGTWNLVTVPYYYDTGEAEAKQFLPPEDFFYFKYYLDYKDKK